MRLTEDSRELLQRYLAGVARRLPLQHRKDITKEISSALLDALDERFGDEEVEVNRLEEFLLAYGSPAELTRSFRQDRFLIGPELYDLYRMVTGIVLIVVASATLINLIVRTVLSGPAGLVEDLFGLLIGLFTAFGSVTFVFTIIQRSSKNFSWADPDDHWKIHDIPKLEAHQRLGIADPIATIVASVFFIIVINFFRDLIGIRINDGATCTVYRILLPGFVSLIPVFTVRWSLDIVASILRLIRRRKDTGIMVFEGLLTCFDIAIVMVLLRRGMNQFLDFSGLDSTEFSSLIPLITWLFNGVLVIILVISIIELVKTVYHLVNKPTIEL